MSNKLRFRFRFSFLVRTFSDSLRSLRIFLCFLHSCFCQSPHFFVPHVLLSPQDLRMSHRFDVRVGDVRARRRLRLRDPFDLSPQIDFSRRRSVCFCFVCDICRFPRFPVARCSFPHPQSFVYDQLPRCLRSTLGVTYPFVFDFPNRSRTKAPSSSRTGLLPFGRA